MDSIINDNNGNFIPKSKSSSNVWTTFVYDKDLRLVDILNPDYTKMLVSDESTNIIGMDLKQLNNLYHGHEKKTFQYIAQKIIQVSHTGNSTYFEYVIENSGKDDVVVLCYVEKSNDGYIYGRTLHLDSNIIYEGRKNFTENIAYDVLENIPASISIRHYNNGDNSEYVYFNKKLKDIFKCKNVFQSPLWNQEEANRFDAETLQSDLPLTKYSISKNEKGNVELVLELHKYKIDHFLDGQYILTAAIDITEKYLADKEIKKQYITLETIYRGLPFGLVGFDKDGCIVVINKQAMELYGVKDKNTAIGHSMFDDPNLSSEIKHSIRTMDDVEYLLNYDFKAAKSAFGDVLESGYKQINNRVLAIKDENGARAGFILLCEDKTEEINKKHTFEIIKSRFGGIYDSINSGILIYDTNNNFADCNTTAMKILGIRNKSDILNNEATARLFRDICTEMLEKWENADGDFISKYYDFSLLKKDEDPWSTKSGRAYLEGKVSYLKGENGRSLGYLLVFNDITERKKKEKELMVKNAKLEEYQRITELESKAANILQWEFYIKTQCISLITHDPKFPPSGVDINKYLTFIHPDDLPLVIERTKKMMIGELLDEECQFNYRIKLPIHKEYKSVVLTGIGIRGTNGKLYKYTGFRRDMTDWTRLNDDLKKKNKELIKAKQLAEESDRLKSAFLANMSHEIRTPLNAIVGFSDVLVNASNNDEKEEYAKIISKNSALLLNLLNDILDISKIESGMVDIRNNIFNMHDCLNNVIDTIQPRYINHNVKLTKEMPDINCYVNLDLHRMEQIYYNFLTNAFKFTEKGEIRIGYKTDNKGIQIFVSDTGIGIDKKNYHKLFTRFEKVDSFKQGTGLGLAICKAITDACHGKIGFKSEVNKGSTFWAWFPTEVNIGKNKLTI